jgi:hypothetical protein
MENIKNENIGLEMSNSASSIATQDEKYISLMSNNRIKTINELEMKYIEYQNLLRNEDDPITCCHMRRTRCRQLYAEVFISLLFVLILAIIIGLIIIELDLMKDVRDLVPW